LDGILDLRSLSFLFLFVVISVPRKGKFSAPAQ
jgi:hypothetical protein